MSTVWDIHNHSMFSKYIGMMHFIPNIFITADGAQGVGSLAIAICLESKYFSDQLK